MVTISSKKKGLKFQFEIPSDYREPRKQLVKSGNFKWDAEQMDMVFSEGKEKYGILPQVLGN